MLVYFFTDGHASYPKSAVNKIKSLDPSIRNKIKFIAQGFGDTYKSFNCIRDIANQLDGEFKIANDIEKLEQQMIEIIND